MRVLKSKFVRVFLVLVLVLSFSISSAFADSSSIYFPITEPSTADGSGYALVSWRNNSTGALAHEVVCWSNWKGTTSLSASSSGIVFTFANVSGDETRSVVYSASGSPIGGSGAIRVRFAQSGVSNTFSYSLSGYSLVNFSPVGSKFNYVTNFDNKHVIYPIWADSAYDTAVLVQIFNTLLGFTDSLDSIEFDVKYLTEQLKAIETSNGLRHNELVSYLDSILTILEKAESTTLDESTSPLPNQGLTDFESSQGSLRGDSDVSSSLDNLFNDVDFGSFSNGFSAVWGLVDGVLNSHPIFFTLVILVLSLGLLNLIFNRR